MPVVVSSSNTTTITAININTNRRVPLRDTTTNALDARHTSQAPPLVHKRGNSTTHISYRLEYGANDNLEHCYDHTREGRSRSRKHGGKPRLTGSELEPVPECDSEREISESVSLEENVPDVGLHDPAKDPKDDSSPSSTGNTRTFSHRRRSCSSKRNENKVLYSSRSQTSSATSSASDKDKGALNSVVVIPNSGLSEEEELEVIGGGVITHRRATPPLASPPIFRSEPLRSEGVSRIVDYVLQLSDEEEEEKKEEKDEVVPLFQVKRKPPPPLPLPATRSLCDIQREVMLSRYMTTRPITPSLLSFTDETSRICRRRFHPLRLFKPRYSTPESDLLRKRCLERRRLERIGLLDQFSSLVGEGGGEEEIVGRGSTSWNPCVFPRSGNLHDLRSPESTAWAEDWSLGYVDLSFIHKSLYSFDLRMRMGNVVGELWAEEEEKEILGSFGRDREWEYDWECRWRVASWLMSFDEVEEEGEESK